MTTVVVAGSRALPQGHAARVLIRFLAALEPDTLVLMRRGLNTQPGHFEAQAEHVIDLVGLRLEWCQPQPGGRREVFDRDMAMVERADLVIAFVTEDQLENEDSGTFSLAEKARASDKPSYLYTINEDGDVEAVGSWDPEEKWSELVPAV